MDREVFEKRYEADWRFLEGTLAGRGHRETSLTRGFPELYRRVCHQLALARHRRYGADLELRLNRLALSGHQVLYGGRTHEAGLLAFVFADFPRLIRREARLVLLATALFLVPALAMAGVSWVRPEAALTVVPAAAIDAVVHQYSPDRHAEAGGEEEERSSAMMFGFYIYNNIGIAFRTFAGGLLGGVGAGLILIFNGLYLGAVAGHIQQAGYGGAFYPFVIGHGAFELTAIVLAGAAGLRLGLAFVRPGRLRRGAAVVLASRPAVRILYGAGLMLVAAAFLEAFWSPLPIEPAAKLWVGGFLWLSVLAYFLFLGRGSGGSP